MTMTNLLCTIITALAAVLTHVDAIELDVGSAGNYQGNDRCMTYAYPRLDSIKYASATLAYGLMSWYQNNQSTTAVTDVGTLPKPLYWWEAGAVWGASV